MLVTIAILLLVYYGMRKETYERTTAYAQMAEKDDELIGKWCGCIMMVCAAAYQLYLEYLECYLDCISNRRNPMWNRVDYIIKRGAFPVKRACYFYFRL